MTRPLGNSRDSALVTRAAWVIPNGMWGHMATRSIAAGYPQFFSRADGIARAQTGKRKVLVDGDQDLRIGSALCLAALRHGVFLHPRHNMFLWAAHSPDDIDRALAGLDTAFTEIVAQGIVPA